MVTPDTMSSPDSAFFQVPPGTQPPSTHAIPADVALPFSRKLWIIAILLAVAAGVGAWAIGESRLVHVEAQVTDIMLMGQKQRSATAATMEAAQANQAMKVFATFGAMLGLAAGFSGGVSRRKLRVALIGCFVGGVSGGLSAFLVMPIHARLVDEGFSEFLTSFVAHAGIWVPIGAAAAIGIALALDLGAKQTLITVIGGIAGAACAAILYDIIGALAFPLGGTALPISTTPESRLLARILLAPVVILTALLAATSTSSRT